MNKITTESPPTQGVDARQWVRAVPVRGAAKSVLFCLQTFADEFGGCWPSIKTLSEACGLCVRSVQRALPELEREGWIKVTHKQSKKGKDKTSHYVLMLSKEVPNRGDIVSTSPSNRGDIVSSKGDIVSSRGDIVSTANDTLSPSTRTTILSPNLKSQEVKDSPSPHSEDRSQTVTDTEVEEHVAQALSGEYGDIVQVRYGKATASQRRSLSRIQLRRERRQCIVCSESLVGLNETLVKCAGCRAGKRAVAG